jgi:predicted murein hydrolase (TIGR00659 family)
MSGGLFQLWVFLARAPLVWLTLTVLAYLAAMWLHRRSGGNSFVNPVLLSVAAIVCVLLATGTPYPAYFEGAKFVHFLIGPATVALAVPLYTQIERLKRMWLPLGVALAVGSGVAIVSAVAIGRVLGASRETLLSLAPKSATMPIAMGVAEQIGGVPALAAMAVAATGIAGAIMARPLLNLLRVSDPAVRGFAVGLAAHAVGTARAIQYHDVAGAFAALALALNGVATALLVPLLARLLQPLLGG